MSAWTYRGGVAGAVMLAAAALTASPAPAQDTVKIAVTAFLSGPAAAAYGEPSRNGAELILEAINAGTLPVYSSPGFAGAKVEAEFVDEAGGTNKQVQEYRNLVQKRGVDAVIGYISSGSCVAIAPVADELKMLTVFATCGTPRIFEEADRTHVFRTMSHATADSVAAAHYIAKKFPELKSYTGINQNYAWGQDSWRDFDLATHLLLPAATASDKLQFPKLFSGQYGTEISALSLDPSELVHTSLWGGDLEAFVLQATPRGLLTQKQFVLTVGGEAYQRLNDKMPDGLVLGMRGPYGIIVKDRDTPLNTWFVSNYKERYGTYPFSGSYEYAQAILATKIAYDRAAEKAGGFPTRDQVIEALTGMEFESLSTKVKMALGKGHQAITEHIYGITAYNKGADEPALSDTMTFPAECVMPPDGVTSVEWIQGGMKGAKC